MASKTHSGAFGAAAL